MMGAPFAPWTSFGKSDLEVLHRAADRTLEGPLGPWQGLLGARLHPAKLEHGGHEQGKQGFELQGHGHANGFVPSWLLAPPLVDRYSQDGPCVSVLDKKPVHT